LDNPTPRPFSLGFPVVYFGLLESNAQPRTLSRSREGQRRRHRINDALRHTFAKRR